MASPTVPAPASAPSHASQPFDVRKAYAQNLTSTTPLPPALAAVSALTSALTTHKLSTVSEALDLLSTLNKALKAGLRNPIPASAGTDAFLQYLVTTVARPGAARDFDRTIQDVLQAGEGFVQRGLRGKEKIARYGRRVVSEGATVVVPVLDEAVEALLLDAADADVRFRVLFVDIDKSNEASAVKERRGKKQDELARTLRELGIPTASVPASGLAHALVAASSALANGFKSNGDIIVITASSALLPNGGVMAPLGTLQACMLAKAQNLRVFVASEIWKMARWFPLEGEEKTFGGQIQWSGSKDGALDGYDSKRADAVEGQEEAVDVTPPSMLCGFITESGIMSPSAISEESVKLWF